MRTIGVFLVVVALGAAPPSTAQATSGMCTIARMAQTNPYPLGIDFPMPIANGLAMPVEFDEAAGTFSMSRDAWHAQFGDAGAEFLTIGGVHGYLRMFAGSTTGTIDASGQISLPGFPIENSTDFVDPPPDLPVNDFDLSTGAVVRSISIVSVASVGAALNFDTGEVVLAGIGFLTNAPGSGGTNIAGFRMACTLAPIPDRAQLQAGAALAKVKGKVKLQKDEFTSGSKADLLMLKATLVPGPTPFVLDGTQDLVLGISVGGEDVVSAFVRGGRFQKKGKKLVVTRDDTCKIKKGATEGVCKNDATKTCESFLECAGAPALQILSGRKQVGNALAQLGGTVTLAPGKRGAATVVTKLRGLDLSALTGPTDASVAVGSQTAGARVDATGGKIK